MPLNDLIPRRTAECGDFADALRENAISPQTNTFDSAAADDFITTATNQATGVKVPENLQRTLDEVGDKAPVVLKAICDGIRVYEREHGQPCPPDVVEQAIHSAYSTTMDAIRRYRLPVFDSADSDHMDTLSLQPNRAVVAILAMMSEAIPFAHYLPADIGSNEAKLGIMQHVAGTKYGQYNVNDSLNGIQGGDRYISSSRIHRPTVTAAGVAAGKLSAVQTAHDLCDQTLPSDLNLLRGRTEVFIDGLPAAMETSSTGTGNSSVSGNITIGGTNYVIGGTINTDTGGFNLTTTPPLPATSKFIVEGYVDYERQPERTPRIITHVDMFKLLANPYRVFTQQSIDARTQMANELGLDPYSESVMAIQQQYSNERHYKVLNAAYRIAESQFFDYDFDWTNQGLQKNRSQILMDFATPIGDADQQMANDTIDHGITHLYVNKYLASMMMSMPGDLFRPSGIRARPGIYRVGTLFGRYEVYYTPKGVSEAVTAGHQTAQVLAIGRGTNVARNPFVLGDAVAPSVIPLAVNSDLKTGAGFYARNFTQVNPHLPSARGCRLINFLNLT